MTEADFSNKKLGPAGGQILIAFIERKSFQNNGSLSNIHVGENSIPKEQMKAIIAMDKFAVRCAVPVKELKAGLLRELDLPGKSLGEGALVLGMGNKGMGNKGMGNKGMGNRGADMGKGKGMGLQELTAIGLSVHSGQLSLPVDVCLDKGKGKERHHQQHQALQQQQRQQQQQQQQQQQHKCYLKGGSISKAGGGKSHCSKKPDSRR